MKCKAWRWIAPLLALLVWFASAPAASAAELVEISNTLRTALDKTMAAANASTKSSLKKQFDEVGTLVEQDKTWEANTKSLQKANDEAEALVRKRIKEIDAVKLRNLDTAVGKAKDRYKPLFEMYTALNKRIELARALKNKLLTSMLRQQADGMKLAVQLAREDIRSKESALKAAKDTANKTIKKIKDALSLMNPVNEQIKAEKTALKSPKERLAAAWKEFGAAARKKDAPASLSALSEAIEQAKRVVGHKKTICDLEKRIGDIIAKAGAQIP